MFEQYNKHNKQQRAIG